MKPINTSTFDFPTLIQEGFVYVDKTRQIYELARRGTGHVYFFPRPRRFGKSLLISTFKALFSGRRELFKGLAISKRTRRLVTTALPRTVRERIDAENSGE